VRRLSRRAFLRLSASSAAFAALARLPTGAAALAAGSGPRFFDDWETELLTQLMERIVDSGHPDAPGVRETGAVAAVDALCAGLDPGVAGQLPWLLRGFEYGSIVFDLRFARFSRMSDAEKDAALEAWMTSRVGLRRMAFYALRNLCFVGWYSQQQTWPLVGYRGPLLAPGATT
jgi:hypothetical protein